jgi:hypothetical protein
VGEEEEEERRGGGGKVDALTECLF